MADIQCTKNDTSEVYEEVFRIVSERFMIQANLSAKEGLEIWVLNLEMEDFNIEKVDHSSIGEIDMTSFTFYVGLFEAFGVPLLRHILNTFPIPLGYLISILFFDEEWVDFDESRLDAHEQYFILFTTPRFNFPDDGEKKNVRRSPFKAYQKRSGMARSIENLLGINNDPIEISADSFDRIS